ncbi:hypothetical protein C3L33_19494, partial [Rhododendron williamsianum]
MLKIGKEMERYMRVRILVGCVTMGFCIVGALVPLWSLAAENLKIKSLLDLTCQTVADMIKGKTPEEIRKTFNIKNEFTPEEEEEVRRENAWAFE